MKAFREQLILILSFVLSTQVFLGTAAQAIDRSTADRPDDIQGHQIHAVYVVPKGGVDHQLDIDGRISGPMQATNSLMQSQLSRKFVFDTFKGELDITFLQSQYNLKELCFENCNALEKLSEELRKQSNKPFGTKTIVFFIVDKLDDTSCGWANRPGNLALVHDLFSRGCSSLENTIAHEVIHTYGIGHTCFSANDLMLGDCSLKRYIGDQVVVDASRSNYVGSESAFGIDLLQMPVWSDNSGKIEYSSIKPTSADAYLPKLANGKVYAIVGKTTGNFDWEWQKKFNESKPPPNKLFPVSGAEIICEISSGGKVAKGMYVDTSCIFEVPDNWRVGNSFEVNQTWVKGPWKGSAKTSGILVRADYTSTPCTQEVCFVGGVAELPSSCWKTNASEITLQQLEDGVWKNIATSPLVNSNSCRAEYPKKPIQNISFSDTGTKIFRWYLKATATQKSYADVPFALVINGAEEREATTSETRAAQDVAVQQGKEADLIPPPSDTTCDITDSGLLCRATIIDLQNWKLKNDENFKWYLGVSNEVTLPLNMDSFVPVSQFFTSKSANASSNITIPYDFIEKLVSGLGSTLRIYAILENSEGKGTKGPASSAIVKLSDIKLSVDRAKLAAAELKAKQEADAKAATSKASKKISITCIKGKLTKKVTGISPKCPSGYTKK